MSALHFFLEINLHAVIRAKILEEVHKKYILYQCIKVSWAEHCKSRYLLQSHIFSGELRTRPNETYYTEYTQVYWQALKYMHTGDLLHRDMKVSHLASFH